MRVDKIVNEAPQRVAIIFGRFNPPHYGHKAAWKTAAKFDKWFVGTNKSTIGEKDPLPYEIKIEAMKAVWPEVANHIMTEQSWFTMASKVYEQLGPVILNVVTDETDKDWIMPVMIQNNGVEGPHGFYKFPKIVWQKADRISSATDLRGAVAKGDKAAFEKAAGVSADTPVAGSTFYEVVSKYLMPYLQAKAEKERIKAERDAKKAAKVKKAGVAEAELDEAKAKAKRTVEDIFIKGKKVGSITTTTTQSGMIFYTAQVGNSFVAGSDTREEAMKHLKRLYRDYYKKKGVTEDVNRAEAQADYMEGQCMVLAVAINQYNPKRYPIGYIWEYNMSAGAPDMQLDDDEWNDLSPEEQEEISNDIGRHSVLHAYVRDQETNEYIDARGRHKTLPNLWGRMGQTRFEEFPGTARELIDITAHGDWDEVGDQVNFKRGQPAFDSLAGPAGVKRALDYAVKYLGVVGPEQAKSSGVAEAEKIAGRYDPVDFDSMVGRVGKLAKAGPMKTVWDPVKRVYKNVPTNKSNDNTDTVDNKKLSEMRDFFKKQRAQLGLKNNDTRNG
jgi:hypothetical protein